MEVMRINLEHKPRENDQQLAKEVADETGFSEPDAFQHIRSARDRRSKFIEFPITKWGR